MTLPGEHILAGFTLGFRHRHELARVMRNVSVDSSVLGIDPLMFKSQGITTLALDFDGVLAPHGFDAPLSEVREWLCRCVTTFGEQGIFILSNKPTAERQQWFAENFPCIRFISGVRKKPLPDGLAKIGELAGVPLSSILMVDDRLFTGCLGAINAGACVCYIRRPFISLSHKFLAELFFILMRKGERLVVGCGPF